MKPNKTFIIRHKGTKEIYRSRAGKVGWKAINHAKAAWANSWRSYTPENYPQYHISEYFDDQDVYEIVEVKPDPPQEYLEAMQACIDIYKDFEEHEIMGNSRSIWKAWELGRKCCDE